MLDSVLDLNASTQVQLDLTSEIADLAEEWPNQGKNTEDFKKILKYLPEEDVKPELASLMAYWKTFRPKMFKSMVEEGSLLRIAMDLLLWGAEKRQMIKNYYADGMWEMGSEIRSEIYSDLLLYPEYEDDDIDEESDEY